MFYLFAVIVAALLVSGQSLWKVGVEKIHFELTPSFFFSHKIFGLIFSPYVLLGLVLYVFATLLYLNMLAKYPYSHVQAAVIPLSLLASFIIAYFIFSEHFSILNMLGALIILVGIGLVTIK